MIWRAVSKRIKAGAVEGFTKTYKVNRLVYVESFPSINEARARERTLKRWRRNWKMQLIEFNNRDWKDLSSQLLY